MPPRRVQRGVRRPVKALPVRLARVVLVRVGRAQVELGVQARERVHVRAPGVRVHDLERGRVDLIEPEARVEIVERREGRTDL
jgi:hypothetical protein